MCVCVTTNPLWKDLEQRTIPNPRRLTECDPTWKGSSHILHNLPSSPLDFGEVTQAFDIWLSFLNILNRILGLDGASPVDLTGLLSLWWAENSSRTFPGPTKQSQQSHCTVMSSCGFRFNHGGRSPKPKHPPPAAWTGVHDSGADDCPESPRGQEQRRFSRTKGRSIPTKAQEHL